MNRVYTDNTMRCFSKPAVGMFIVVLALFAGSFCVHPIGAQAMDDMSTDNGLSMSHDREVWDQTTWSKCVVDCVRIAPQALAAKQFNVTFGQEALLMAGVAEDWLSLYGRGNVSEPDDTPPPAPDTLSSVLKKE